MARTMALIEPSLLQTIQLNRMTTLPTSQNIKTRVLQELDNNIKTTLADDMLTPSDKLFYYNQALQSRDQYSDARTASQIEPPKKIIKTDDDFSIEDEVLASVPPSLREKAKLILKRFKNTGVLGWNEHTGRMLYKGSEVDGTNIVDIVNTLLRERKSRPDPVGWGLIKQGVQELNLPTELVGNKNVYNTSSDIPNIPRRISKPRPSKRRYYAGMNDKPRQPRLHKRRHYDDQSDDDDDDQSDDDRHYYDAQRTPSIGQPNFNDDAGETSGGASLNYRTPATVRNEPSVNAVPTKSRSPQQKAIDNDLKKYPESLERSWFHKDY